jgi:hypothetical protein
MIYYPDPDKLEILISLPCQQAGNFEITHLIIIF